MTVKGVLTQMLSCAILVVMLLAGCTSAPVIEPLPLVSSEMDTQEDVTTRPLPLAEWPTAELVATDKSEYLCFDRAGAMALFEQRERAEGNTAIASALADQVDTLYAERAALIKTGRACEQHDAVLAEALQQARDKAQEKLWWHRGVIGALFLVLIL